MLKRIDQDSQPLSHRSVLFISGNGELMDTLESAGARVFLCPAFEIGPPESYEALDEAIANLYGYDWLIFISRAAVEAFLQRLHTHKHTVGDLDDLKVCALGESAISALEEARVHIDLMPAQCDPASVAAELSTYLGGVNQLAGLNVLIPQAAIARHYLKDSLEQAGTRTDVVAAYRTVAAGDSSLSRLRTLLISGGIDCAIFQSEADLEQFARLFDIHDLGFLTAGTIIVCLDEPTAQMARRFGIQTIISTTEPGAEALAKAIAAHFSG